MKLSSLARGAVGGALISALVACGGDASDVSEADVLENYAAVAHANYSDALSTAQAMEVAIDAFVANPTAATHQAAKDAWLAARIPYGQSEAFRFYDGPIDNPTDGPEGQLNAWPLDEAYIDYVDGADMAGIVNDPSIDITVERLAGLNEGGEGDIFGLGGDFDADKAVATGYHAIEFLLWGQDMDPNGAGARSHLDFVTGMDATAPNGDRRGQYLQVATDLLISDLEAMVAAWAPDSDNYRATFVQGGSDQIAAVIASIGILSKGELGGERMDVALDTRDQEDEHSCFSDNTHIDIEMNARGIQNVYLGTYGDVSGPSLRDMLAAADADTEATVTEAISTAVTRAAAVPQPFDQAITDPMSADYMAVDSAVEALFDAGDAIATMGPALGLGTISVELPE